MLAPTRSSHQKHVSPVHDRSNLPPFSLPGSLGEEGEFMSFQKGLDQLEKSKAGFIGANFAYLVAKKL